MKISVTQAHIDTGVPIQCSKCPIALAVGDVVVGEVAVGIRSLCIETYWIDLPSVAQQFIRAYDDGTVVEPFEFEVEIPRSLLRSP